MKGFKVMHNAFINVVNAINDGSAMSAPPPKHLGSFIKLSHFDHYVICHFGDFVKSAPNFKEPLKITIFRYFTFYGFMQIICPS